MPLEVPPRYRAWLQRAAFGARGGLDFAEELWREDLLDHPAYAALRELAEQRGRSELLLYRVTSNLLPDLIHAAGGIEYTVGRIGDLMRSAQEWVDRYIDPLGEDEAPPEHGRGVGTVEDALVGWEYGNLLAWTRAFEDRMSRTWIGGGELGLLPAMNPQHPATREISRLWEAFKSKNLLKDVREQAALGLHASSIHPAGSGARLTDDNRVLLRAPDRLAKKVTTRDELTFNDSRDVLSFAQTVLDDVGRVMDELLAVLERYGRDRWMPPKT